MSNKGKESGVNDQGILIFSIYFQVLCSGGEIFEKLILQKYAHVNESFFWLRDFLAHLYTFDLISDKY